MIKLLRSYKEAIFIFSKYNTGSLASNFREPICTGANARKTT